MKKYCSLLSLLILMTLSCWGQDYFTDRSASGSPILMKYGGKSISLFSALVDVSDKTAIKANFYNQFRIQTDTTKNGKGEALRQFFGWGVNLKAKAENGLGNLFKSGKAVPGLSTGGYLSYTRRTWSQTSTEGDPDDDDNTVLYGTWGLILSGSLSYAHQQFYHPTQAFGQQLSDDELFKGGSLSLSFFKKIFKGKNNKYWGLSMTYSSKNNYSELETVEIKNDRVFTDNGEVRTVSKVNDNGDIYATGDYKAYGNLNFRANFAIVPELLNYRIGFIAYPSVDLSNVFEPKLNIGLAFNYLKDKSPELSVASLFFEFNDLQNAAGSNKHFLKRTFKVGVSTSLNIITGGK